ncbi:MAG TPA: DUF4286 family protein [Holophagaceae bacterium]|nr:DUF4286 family protein [Holophagaceae bacterium]
MVVYEVRVEVRPDLVPAFEAYMAGKHLPEILATGCFTGIRFERLGDATFRSRYEAPDRAAVDRYLADHTPRFRADFLAHFPEGCAVSREIWEEAARFG